MQWKPTGKAKSYQRVLMLAWPSILGNLATTITTMVDTVSVSPLGPAAVAAVGITSQPTFLLLTPITALYVAAAAIIARRIGAEEKVEAHRTMVTLLASALVIFVAIALVANLFASPLLHLLGSNPEIHDTAVLYFRIIETGAIFNIITMMVNAAQSGAGNTRVAFASNLIMTVVNACCNYLLIQGHLGFPAWGVMGAAIASILSQFCGMLVSVRSLFLSSSTLQLRYVFENHIRPTLSALGSLLKIGVTVLVENLLMRIGFLVTATQAAGLGTYVFATHNAGMNLLNFGFSLANGMQTAAVASVGSALGAGQKEEAITLGRICRNIGLGLAILWSVTLFFVGGPFFRLLFDGQAFVDRGIRISHFVMVIVLLQIQQVIYAGSLRAAGDVRYTLVASTISVAIIRSLSTLLFVQVFHWGINGIWLGILCDQFMRFVLMGTRFRQGKWVNLQI